jgi:hypothetical protein
MGISYVAVGAKITAATTNAIIQVANEPGLTSVIPTSVAGTGVTVGPNGVVTFTGASSVSINGCFSAAFDNYLIEFTLTTSAAAGINVSLRLSGTDSSTGYDSQRFTAINSTAAAVQSLSGTSWVGSGGLGNINARQAGELVLYGPALAVATVGLIRTLVISNPMTTASGIYHGGLGHQSASAYDGLTLAPGAGNITGTLRIYGYTNN